jgi:trimethylamine--corrinoid protein Co-methyltransferase
MQPKIELLSYDLIARILDEAFQLMQKPGVKVQSARARDLLAAGGAGVSGEVVCLPEGLVRRALETTCPAFDLYDADGEAAVHYGGEAVHFDPGSCALDVLETDNLEHRRALTRDLIRLVQTAEMLPEFAAQSTAVLCSDVHEEISDLYRLYVVLLHSRKPIVTGSFSVPSLGRMIEMLAICAGGRQESSARPRAVFDVCPSPPLIWSEFGAENLIELARAGIPVQIVSMPLAGAAAPVTLLGSVVQHAAECLSGLTIHQLARPGAPIVWGGAPAIFDMRRGTTPMGAIETAMIDAAYAQVGKSLNLPTHGYLCASDAKILDAQAGLESGMTALVGALTGINMISGAGMLDFLACQSAEKLVVDAEAIAMARRLRAGLEVRTTTLAAEFFQGIDFKGDFLRQKATRKLFPLEQHLPSDVIDRESIRAWQAAGRQDTFARARRRVGELLAAYRKPEMPADRAGELTARVTAWAYQAGMDRLPAPDA